jgi:hypothetical protein
MEETSRCRCKSLEAGPRSIGSVVSP